MLNILLYLNKNEKDGKNKEIIDKTKENILLLKELLGELQTTLLNREFKADKPNEKWYIDVTNFNKTYLSPILDGYNQEVISHNIFNK